MIHFYFTEINYYVITLCRLLIIYVDYKPTARFVNSDTHLFKSNQYLSQSANLNIDWLMDVKCYQKTVFNSGSSLPHLVTLFNSYI